MADIKAKEPNAANGTSEHVKNPTSESATVNGAADEAAEDGEEDGEAAQNPVFQITVKLPHKPYDMPVMVSPQEQVHDLRQSITEQPDTFQYSCFHLEHNGVPINDFVELSEVKGLAAGSEVRLVESPYTEKEARTHTIRVRDLIGASGDRIDVVCGLGAGETLLDTIVLEEPAAAQANGTSAKIDSPPVVEYDFDSAPSINTILPEAQEAAPKTVKSLVVSPWNPPPHHLRQMGHLIYLLLTTSEGEQFQITGHVTGFYVSRSSNAKFDPMPRAAPKDASAHSLLSLISKLSPSFDASFVALQEYNSRRDPLVNFQITNTIPANPWLVSPSTVATVSHQPDLTRSQEAYLLSGLENTDTLRDWNEEFQSTRELPRETVQDRVFRERITSKLFADYNEAAIRGAMLCARGEIAPLNPTEQPLAQIFVYNNIFFSFGADGVGTFTSEGGDPAARAAVGKDVAGVKIVNQLDIEGLFTPGTIIVDYLGKRIVCQSLVPGIFKQREPDEYQINYGGVEGRDIVTSDEAFAPVFSKLSKAFRIKRHPVWDKEGKRHDLEGSVETKGMLGTDGRKYVLDLYRLTPLDISWIEQYWCDVAEGETKPADRDYPHRMSVLRPELVEGFWRSKLTEYVSEELKSRQKAKAEDNESKRLEENANGTSDESKKTSSEQTETKETEDRVDVSGFTLEFNPDVCCGQAPQTDAEKEELLQDERRVREVSEYLSNTVIPQLVRDLEEGDVGFPMDGASLSRLLHKRGINVRYLGRVAQQAQPRGPRLATLAALATQEMIARAFKHIASGLLRQLPAIMATTCLSHLLNCLLGISKNKAPKVSVDEDIKSLFPNSDWSFAELTPVALCHQIQEEVRQRYRFSLPDRWSEQVKHLQLLREISLKLGIQLAAKDFQFVEATPPVTNGESTHSEAPVVNHNTTSKRKKKNGEHKLDRASNESLAAATAANATTFTPSDIVNLVPVIKDSAPKSTLAEEALEAGRLSLAQNQKELGQELLLESLSLHEQIYGIVHPEVARVYHQLSMFYYQLDIKDAAAELARKAVILSERTLGLDHNETVLSYLNLGLFEHANGRTSAALHYIQHALELWKIIFGLHHPDSITTLNNAAVMLQSLKQYHASRIWFEKSLELSTRIAGSDAISTGTLAFQLAQALALDHDAHAAVTRMREAYATFLSRLGPNDRSTKEAESWLEQLTQNAVSVAKHAKDVQARRLRRVQMTPHVTLPVRPQPAVGQSSAEAAGRGAAAAGGANGVDSRSVDELIRFIEGGGDTAGAAAGAGKGKKRGGRTNPKKRTAVKAS